MPELDGWGVLRALQADPQTRAIPVVIVSGHVLGSAEQIHAWGAVRLLPKPFPLTKLPALVCELLELPGASG